MTRAAQELYQAEHELSEAARAFAEKRRRRALARARWMVDTGRAIRRSSRQAR